MFFVVVVVVVVVFLNERGVRRVFCMPEGDSSTGFSCKQKQQNVCVCFYICASFIQLSWCNNKEAINTT